MVLPLFEPKQKGVYVAAKVKVCPALLRQVTSDQAKRQVSCRHFDTYNEGTDVRSVRQYEFVVRAVATLGDPFLTLLS